MATDNIATLGIKVDPKGAIAGASRAKRAIRGIGNTANNIKSQIFSLNGALGALGAGMVVKSALNYASSVEKLQLQLKFLTGDTKSAAKAFSTLTKFASKAPFTLKEIQKAAAPLTIVADNTEELNELLSMTGDIATVTGMDFEVVAQNMLRAMEGGIGASEMFKEKGVKNMLGFVDGVEYAADATKKRFFDAFRDGTTAIKGATAEMATTFDGQVSMMGDAWDALQLAFMKEGVFGSTKSQVKDLTEWLKSPDVIQGAKDLGKSVTSLAKGIKDAITEYNGLPEWVRTSGLVLAIFGGKIGKAGMIAMIAYAKELKAILQEVGAIDHSPKQITDAIKQVEDRIVAVKKQMGGQELSFLKKVFFAGNPLIADQNMLDDLEEKLADLREQYNNLPTAIKTNFEKGVSTTPDIPDTTNTDTAEPVGGLSEKRLEKLRGGIISYKDSIKDVGIEVTKGMQLGREYRKEVEKIKSALDVGKISGDEYGKMLVDMTSAYGDAIKRMDEADIAKKVAGLTSSMSDSITSMIMNIGQGTQNLKESVKDMARVVLAEFIKIKVAQPLAQGMANAFNFSSMFRADGGTVTGNQPYVVGEQGAELFVPNKTGTIIPNDAMSSGGSSSETNNVNVSFNITANDTQGFDDLLDSRRGMIVGIINQAMNDRGMTGVTA